MAPQTNIGSYVDLKGERSRASREIDLYRPQGLSTQPDLETMRSGNSRNYLADGTNPLPINEYLARNVGIKAQVRLAAAKSNRFQLDDFATRNTHPCRLLSHDEHRDSAWSTLGIHVRAEFELVLSRIEQKKTRTEIDPLPDVHTIHRESLESDTRNADRTHACWDLIKTTDDRELIHQHRDSE